MAADACYFWKQVLYRIALTFFSGWKPRVIFLPGYKISIQQNCCYYDVLSYFFEAFRLTVVKKNSQIKSLDKERLFKIFL